MNLFTPNNTTINKRRKALAGWMILAVLCMNFPLTAKADTLGVTLTANGQADALVLPDATTPFTYAWNSTGATACQFTSPTSSNTDLSGSVNIAPGNTWYPTATATTTITVTCTDGTTNVSKTVLVSIGSGSTGGSTGGGAGGGSGALTVDLKVNGSDGPNIVLASTSTPFTYTWSASASATACQFTAPTTSNSDTSGGPITVAPGNTWYPSTTTPTTITVVCTDGSTNTQDSITVSLPTVPTGGGSSPTVDLKVNGSDGPVVVLASSSTPFTYTWSSTNATACQFTSPTTSNTDLAGGPITIAPGNTWYPASTSTVITIVCTNGVTNTQDSVTVSLPGASSTLSVDLKVNGSDGPTVDVTNGNSYSYTWTSAGATACQFTSPTTSNTDLAGGPITIAPGNSWYPGSIGGTTTLTVVCTNGTSNTQDTVTVRIVGSNGGGGGGGGGSSTNSPNSSAPGAGAVTTGAACLFIKDYMRMDFQNDPVEVMKLQSFLKIFEGYDYVQINGTFDGLTLQAVNAFQMKYFNDILAPWGHTGPTGYVYILTLKKINELYCLHAFPLNEAQAQEIIAFRELITGLRAQGINVVLPVSFTGSGSSVHSSVTNTTIEVPGNGSTTATTTVSVPIVGMATSTATTTNKGQNPENFAAALFSAPASVTAGFQCLYEFLLILVVLYILGSVLEDVLYKKEDLTAFRKRFYAKWCTVIAGLIIAGIVAYMVGEYCLLLPLMIALIIALVWTIFAPRREEFKVKAAAVVTTVTEKTTTKTETPKQA